jgi:hypothetical protein
MYIDTKEQLDAPIGNLLSSVENTTQLRASTCTPPPPPPSHLSTVTRADQQQPQADGDRFKHLFKVGCVGENSKARCICMSHICIVAVTTALDHNISISVLYSCPCQQCMCFMGRGNVHFMPGAVCLPNL